MSFLPLVVAYGAMFFEGGLNVILSALMLPLSMLLCVDVGKIALLIAVKNLFTLAFLYISGFLSDRYGRKYFIGIGGCFFLIFLVVMLMSHNFYWAIIASACAGIGHGFMDSPSQSLIFDVFGDQAGSAMSFVQVFFAGGAMLTSLLAAYFLNVAIDYKLLFILLCFIGFVLLVLSQWIKYPERKIVESNVKYNTDYKKLLWLLSLTFCYGCYFILLITWLPLYLTNVFGFSESFSVLMLTFNQLGSIVGSLCWAYLLSKWRLVSLMKMNAFLGLIVILGVLFVKIDWLVVVLVILLGFILGNFFSCCIGLGGELFVLRKGWITGLVASANMLAASLLASISGFLVTSFGVWLVFGLAGLFVVLCVVLVNVIYRLYYSH